MDKFKYIMNKAECGKPVAMRFYGPVDRWSCQDFVREFDWLCNDCKPSEIVVFINSEGGSVVSGMQVFAAINNCKIKTKCIIDGLAASMGSVIWAAGEKLYMRDYSILMVHNPFSEDKDPEDKNTCAAIEAFRQQIETIYTKRFGIDSETVKKIMDGEEGVDGTYMTAQEAVAKGILPADHVIATSEQTRASLSEKTIGIEDSLKLAGIMASVNIEEALAGIKSLPTAVSPNPNRDENPKSDNTITINNSKNNMDEKVKAFDFLCASLGLAQESAHSTVTAKVQELINASKKLTDVEAQLATANKTVADLNIKLEGKNAEVANLSKSLEETKASLKTYQDAEAKAKANEIEMMVSNAIKDGKILAEAKDQWLQMANSNFDLAKATIDSIPARENIIDSIASEPSNQQAAKEAVVDDVQKKVNEVVGDFSFKKF